MNVRDLLLNAPEVAPERVWPTPEPLEDLNLPTPEPFNALELLPHPLGPWAHDLAQRMNAPEEFTVTAALVATAGVVGNRVLIAPDPEADPDWHEAPNLWGLLVGEPGTKKSPIMERAFAPLHAIEAELHEENQRRRTEWELARRNRKRGETTEADLTPPMTEALVTHDITPERLADLLEANPYGLVAFQDELLGLIATWERPERAGERQFYLKLWNGLSPHTVRRIGRGDHYLPICTLSLLGGAQPGPFRRYILEAHRGWNNDGLLPRFQLIVYAELPPYQRVVRPHEDLQRAYSARLRKLWETVHHLPEVPTYEVRRGVIRHRMTFSPEAQEAYLQWHAEVAQESRHPSTPTLVRSLLEKQVGLVPKLALLLHLVEGYPRPEPQVGKVSTLRAIALANLYRAHFLNLWQEAIRPEVQGAILLGKKILERTQTKSAFNYQRFTERDILRANWKGLGEPEAVRRALEVLEARGWIARESHYWVPNPRLWEDHHG